MYVHPRLTLLSLALLSAPLACADDIGTTGASESTTGTSTGEQTTTNTPTAPTTVTPTTTIEPTTDPSTSTGPATVTNPSTSTGPATVTNPSTSTGETTATTGTTGTTGDTTTGGFECTIGEVNCACDNGICNGMSTCILDKCLPIGDGSCATEFNFVCDEPGDCAPGTDPFDCCATLQDGVCEEVDFGGMCAPYSDFFDCGECAFENDGECDAGTFCPEGTNVVDCTTCQFEDDGECDVPEFCPEGTDLNDCCAHPQDGVCEEMQAGGMCPDGTDPFDCGVCPFEDDGECDVPTFCPEGTNANDCCATPKDGVCEEMQAGGMCPDGTDPYDCGVCPFEDDGECDVPQFCPENTDVNDCCATPKDGVCEEMQFGGMCPDGSDPYDCGVCPFEDDGECDVPQFCPENTNVNDCCATPQDGVCEEMQFGGLCSDGTNFFDCDYCPFEDDGFCNVPELCPPDTDVNDCQ